MPKLFILLLQQQKKDNTTKKLQKSLTMSSIKILIILFVISLMLIHSQAANYVYHTCNTGGGSNYTKGSALDMNVQHVFTTLPNAAASNQGYNSTVYGKAPNTVYALAECRGDMIASQCLSCLQDAVASLQNLCGRLPGGQVWFDECFLRWENNTNFLGQLGQLDTNDGTLQLNLADASNPKVFSTAVIGLLTNLTKEVVKPNNSRRYASGSFTDSSFHKIYALVQCWKDISIVDCKRCLSAVVDSISDYATKLGVRRFTASCTARYETYSFFTASPSPPPPPRGPPPSPPLVSTDENNSDSNSKRKLAIILGAVGGSILLSLLLFSSCYIAVRRKRQTSQTGRGSVITQQSSFPNDDKQIFYNIGTLIAATSNFSDVCKLGRGGFGVVYKGTLPNGKEVAVKKLSEGSSQGKKEFQNEIRLVAGVQHRNLVNLLGCCTDGSERILIYEYLTNKSLDKFLFDSEKAKIIDWQKRVNIILNVARGLVYLHEDSKLKIIHRDIKASNILLDDKFNAKIADFGLAKLFPEDQSRIQTRVAGTYGYMAPEYVMHGQLSTKADVYSFGVLLLEIISGRKNNDFISDNGQTFLGWAWNLYREGNFIGIVDETLKASCNYEQVVRCIHVGFLCTQGDPSLRLPMSEVIMMLSSNSARLPTPTMPTFFNISQNYGHENSSEVSYQLGTSARDSITTLEPRQMCPSDSLNHGHFHKFPFSFCPLKFYFIK